MQPATIASAGGRTDSRARSFTVRSGVGGKDSRSLHARRRAAVSVGLLGTCGNLLPALASGRQPRAEVSQNGARASTDRNRAPTAGAEPGRISMWKAKHRTAGDPIPDRTSVV